MATGARDGDLVRARANRRESDVVVGVLRLRHVPSLNYVQVAVWTDQGVERVDPASIEVIKPGIDEISDEDIADPLKDDPGWRRIIDLDAALLEGLVPAARQRVGGGWEELADHLRQLALPLMREGWSVPETDWETNDEYGDSVHLILDRDGTTIDLELYEDGDVVLWPVNFEKYESDDWEPEEPLATVEDASVEGCWAAFVEAGWLHPER